MATINSVDPHGLEVIRRSGMIPDDTNPTRYALRNVLYDASGNAIEINDSGQLKVVLDGKVCPNNTTQTPLAADAVFNGTSGETLDYALIFVSVFSDVASATNGLKYFTSSDNVTFYAEDSFTIPANTNKTFSFQPNRRYFKVQYTNGGTDQTTFDLQTIFKKTNSKASSHKISDSIVTEDDAELVKAVLTGKNPAGNFVNFEATTSGNFKCSLEELENNVSVNSNKQLKTTSFDSSGNEGQTIIGVNKISGKDGIDSATNTLQFISYEHHEIHSGSHFTVADVVDLSINNVFDIQITTPNTTKWTHFTFQLTTEAETEWHFYEGVTINTAGTAEMVYNNDRNSANASTLVVNGITNTNLANANADTAVAAATDLLHGISGAGRTAGADTREREIILKQNTIYSLRFIATAAGYIDYTLEWYEHTNKN